MRQLTSILAMSFFMLFSHAAFAMLSMELTRGVSGAMPLSIKPFTIQGQMPSQDIAAIISHDLKNSGRFKVSTGSADDVVMGAVQEVGMNRYQVSFQLIERFKGKGTSQPTVLLNHKYVVSGEALRSLAHHISDAIYQQMTGVRGIFSTRLAYVVVQRTGGATKYVLEVADQDGYNPRPMLVSTDPIMSPAWSHDGKRIAYVSFENQHAAVYVEEVATGVRHLVSDFRGINGAPAWSPDGRKLALVLSKSGSPNIYVMDLASRQLTQLTHDDYINTEPSWSPDGKNLVFTSNRSGNPQIYQLSMASKAVTRLTYEGKYNARASYTPDGNHITMLNQESGLYNIGILDLDTGIFRVLTNSTTDNESPSIAPNGSMVLFGTLDNGRSVLGMVATDGSVQIRLPARQGEVQDPAWSPFMV
ncbi:MAG: tolB [Gammaproteobacteria bacterium]|jgi:TolB protein|nr:tolB [Gammaproteobacteria bacterium]